ncbi:MAG: exonuclease SbcCD subunit D [Firmicutes bacterium]|nr:exonuclease SbcCD subunit D [Bacillota bacterium]
MKFLHIADLHIGKSVNGFSMLEEQRHAFAQILARIETEQPAAVLIAGDVYDRALPGTEAVGVFDDFLTALADTGAAVLLISGNHDSPERLDFASRLLQEKKLYLCGSFDGDMQKVTLPDAYGAVNFWLLPFVKYDAVGAALEAADIATGARNVLVSHQFYTRAGLIPLRSESELNPVGGLDAADAALLTRFDYAALGHLHGAQSLGEAKIRYAGSPVKYSFSEWRQEKSVTLVELREKGNLTLTALPLAPLHDMREIKGKLETLISPEIASLADREDYLRVILTDEEELADPVGKLRSVYPNLMSLDFENARTGIDPGAVRAEAAAVEKLSPYELFGAFFLETQGSVLSAVQAGIVRELLEGVHEA